MSDPRLKFVISDWTVDYTASPTSCSMVDDSEERVTPENSPIFSSPEKEDKNAASPTQLHTVPFKIMGTMKLPGAVHNITFCG